MFLKYFKQLWSGFPQIQIGPWGTIEQIIFQNQKLLVLDYVIDSK